MQQPFCQTFKLQDHSINLNLWIEIASSSNQREPLTSHSISKAELNGNRHPMANSEIPLPPVKNNDMSRLNQEIEEDGFIANLKERLEQEYHQARTLEEYAPCGIDAYSACQIMWDAPSPIQGDDNGEVEGI
ncbi:hypothetical protein BDR06DRAFT_1007128 [Suillus hirtellus]|nr:hypothetical protein BDR06DRAFT_1007128 [Suillus hirtellus]